MRKCDYYKHVSSFSCAFILPIAVLTLNQPDKVVLSVKANGLQELSTFYKHVLWKPFLQIVLPEKNRSYICHKKKCKKSVV